jgi:hypothetical protein
MFSDSFGHILTFSILFVNKKVKTDDASAKPSPAVREPEEELRQF